jgi:4'-phosphopantetheinyl transferase
MGNGSGLTAWMAQSEGDLPETLAWLSPRERNHLTKMRFTKRRVDYLLGRWTGKCAVARALGLHDTPESLREIEVGHRQGGAPEVRIDGFRAPVEISLSDRAGWGVCLVSTGPGAVGCDLELEEPRSDAFVQDYFTEAECTAVANAVDAAERARLANLIWCAKETGLKILGTGLRRDTRDVVVSLPDAEPLEGWRPLRLACTDGKAWSGWWRQFGVFLLTVAAESSSHPPRSLVEPSPLASAEPSHRWLSEPLAAGAD